MAVLSEAGEQFAQRRRKVVEADPDLAGWWAQPGVGVEKGSDQSRSRTGFCLILEAHLFGACRGGGGAQERPEVENGYQLGSSRRCAIRHCLRVVDNWEGYCVEKA